MYHCYRVLLVDEMSWPQQISEVEHNGKMIPTENGAIYTIATDMAAVAREFPKAVMVMRIGIGYVQEAG